ncbi:hypothetical protein [Pseudomonas peli]|uniref:hypothetical protein n=1 Tax=Pseudomonas peli TaxID=592361 RepID=UPI003D315246
MELLRLRVLFGLLWFSVTGADANQFTYTGSVGQDKVELILIHDYQLDALSGYLFNQSGRQPVTLEKTPYLDGEGLLINIMDIPRMASAALSLEPFVLGAQTLQGNWVDLKTRERRSVDLRRAVHFSYESRDAYVGEMLQAKVDKRFYYLVHAQKQVGEPAGRVDHISVRDRVSGELVQKLDGLNLFFRGAETLELVDFNGDGTLDFRVTPMLVRASDGAIVAGDPWYYLYQDAAGYQRHPSLEALAKRGHLRFDANGRVSLRPEAGVDYQVGTIQWEHYSFAGTLQLKLHARSEETF